MNQLLQHLNRPASRTSQLHKGVSAIKKTTLALCAVVLLLPLLTALPAHAAVPNAPTDLVIDTTTQTPKLSWTDVPGATSYTIYRHGQNIGSSTTATYTDYQAVYLSPDFYPYYVTAVNGDGESSPSETVTITLEQPVFYMLSNGSFLIKAGDPPVNFTVSTNGDEATTITEDGTMPTGLTFTDNGDGTATIAGQPADDTHGSYPITITATDGDEVFVQPFTIYSTNFISPATIAHGTTATFTVSVINDTSFSYKEESIVPTAGATMVSCDSSNPGPSPNIGDLHNGNCFFFYVLNGRDRTMSMTFTATDVNGCANGGKDTFNLSMQNFQNEVPGGNNLGTATVYVTGCPDAPEPPANLAAASPTDAPALSWDAVAGATSYNIYANDIKIGTSTTPSYTDTNPAFGDVTYYVTAINESGESSPSNTINITVASPPAITSAASASVNSRDSFNFTVTTTGSPATTITESGSLPTGIAFNDNGDGTASIVGQATVAGQGSYPITINATNPAGTATQSFVLTVTNNAAAPTFLSANNDTESYGVPFSFTINTSGVPVPVLSKISGSGNLPAGVTLKDNNDGTATLSGQLNHASNSGVFTFGIKAKNSVGLAVQSFTLTITKTPIIKKIGTKTTVVGSSFSQVVSATGSPTPSLSVSGLPDGLSFVDNGDGTGLIGGTPAIGSGRQYNVVINASNIYGGVSSNFTLKVNEAPAIISDAQAAATRGSAFSFQVTATGFPAPAFSETGMLPKGIKLNKATGAFSGTPASTAAGTYPIIVSANNSTGTATQNFVLTVE